MYYALFTHCIIWHIITDWASECLDVKNYKWRLNPVWHRMLYSCTHMGTVGVKGLVRLWSTVEWSRSWVRSDQDQEKCISKIRIEVGRQADNKSFVPILSCFGTGLFLWACIYDGDAIVCIQTLILRFSWTSTVYFSLSLSPSVSLSVCLSVCVCSLVRYQLWGCQVLCFVHYGGRRCVCRLLCPEELK